MSTYFSVVLRTLRDSPQIEEPLRRETMAFLKSCYSNLGGYIIANVEYVSISLYPKIMTYLNDLLSTTSEEPHYGGTNPRAPLHTTLKIVRKHPNDEMEHITTAHLNHGLDSKMRVSFSAHLELVAMFC